MAGGGGCRDERRGSSASEVGTDDGTETKKKDNYVPFDVSFIVPDGKRRVNEGFARRRNTQGTESIPSPALTQLIRN